VAANSIDSQAYVNGSIDQVHLANAIVNEAKMQISNAPTNGYVLTAQSGYTGGLRWAEAGGGATELITTLTANNSSTLNFTGFNASIYGSYLFKVDLKPANQYVSLRALVSTNGGSSYLSGSTQYYADGTNRAYMELSGGGGATAATNVRNGDIVLISPDNTSNYSIFASYVSSGGDAYPGLNNHNRNSVFKSTTAVNAVRFYLALGPQSGGNFTSGTIRVYGFKK
jgi:hypothetical protein